MRVILVTAALCLLFASPAGAAPLSAADRHAIDRALDAFVNSAIKRRNVGASYNLVTPQFRGGTSRAAWMKGNLPVYPYPARGTSFHEWTLEFASPNDVGFQLLIESSKRKTDGIEFTGEIKKINGHWLIDSFMPSATFSGSGTVVGPQDFAASSGGDNAGVASLSDAWLVIPALLLGGCLLLPLGWILYVWRRNRRAYERYRSPRSERASSRRF
jgi:hypothetical protein